MTVPSTDSLMGPLLEDYRKHGAGHLDAEKEGRLAADFGLGKEEREERHHEHRKLTILGVRMAWAAAFLSQAGFLSRLPNRGGWEITAHGEVTLAKGPAETDSDFFAKYPRFLEYLTR